MKILLLCLIVTCCTYIGYGLSSYYRKRHKIFRDCHSFANKLIVEINFAKNNLKEIITNSINSYSSDFKGILNGYLNYLNSDAKILNDEQLFKKNSMLSQDEKQTIFLFFKSLGRYDAQSQIIEIEHFQQKFEQLEKSADAENKKYSALYIKLGLLFGVLIAILLI